MKTFLLIAITVFVIACSKDDPSPTDNGPITGIVNGYFKHPSYSVGDSLDMEFVLDSFINKGNSPAINDAILFLNRKEVDRLALNLKPSNETIKITLPFENQIIEGTVKGNPSQEDIVEIKITLVYSSGINRTFLYVIYPESKKT